MSVENGQRAGHPWTKGDIRDLTIDLLNGKMQRKRPLRKPLIEVKESNLPATTTEPTNSTAIESRSEGSETTIDARSSPPERRSKKRKTRASSVESLADVVLPVTHCDSPLPLNGEDILLVDEVDVFFGADFYGQTYNQVAEIKNALVEDLMRKIWQLRSSKPTFSKVKNWTEFIRLRQGFKDWALQIETEVKKMCYDVQYFKDHRECL